MKDIPEKYKELHKYSFQNEKLLKEVKQCACFYCGDRFNVSDIKQWIEDKSKITAQCPNCSIDSVIPAVIDGNEITDADLKNMYDYWF